MKGKTVYAKKNEPVKFINHFAKHLGPLIRLASEFTAAHFAGRVLAALGGLLLVRILPVSEYGFYTLVLAAFTFICTFSDLGATETLSFFRWRARKKNRTWLHYFHAVVRFRRNIFLLSFPAASIYVIATGVRVNMDWAILFSGILLMGVGAWFAIQSGINSYVLKLEQQFRSAYAVELSNEGTKFIGALAICGLRLTTAVAGISSVALGSSVAAFLSSKLLNQAGCRHVVVTRRRARKYASILRKQILPILPGTIHFALQGPLVAGLAVYYGSISNVAEVGALGRLGQLIGVIAGFTSTVYIPRLLVITDDKLFLRRYFHWWFVIIASGLSILLAVTIFPKILLWVLGEAYSGLHSELLIASSTAVTGVWAAYAWGINRARGWVKYQSWSVPVIICGQLLMVLLLDFSSTAGVLIFGLFSSLFGLCFQLIINAYGFYFNNNLTSVTG